MAEEIAEWAGGKKLQTRSGDLEARIIQGVIPLGIQCHDAFVSRQRIALTGLRRRDSAPEFRESPSDCVRPVEESAVLIETMEPPVHLVHNFLRIVRQET